MTSYEALDQIIAMDFSQLRVNAGTATDEAMDLLVSNLNQFFSQFNNRYATAEEALEFSNRMSIILAKASIVEINYFRNKTSADFPELSPVDIEKMAQATKIESNRDLIKTMQYWARRGSYGDPIHNPAPHIKAIKALEFWPAPPVRIVAHVPFFSLPLARKLPVIAEHAEESRSPKQVRT